MLTYRLCRCINNSVDSERFCEFGVKQISFELPHFEEYSKKFCQEIKKDSYKSGNRGFEEQKIFPMLKYKSLVRTTRLVQSIRVI